jgi:transposase
MPETGLKDAEFTEERVSELLEELARSHGENEFLRQQIAWLKKRLFGPRTERVDPDQLHLDFLDEQEAPPPFAEEAPDDETPAATSKKKSRRNGRAPLPANLRRERVEYHPEPADLICSCCHGEKTKIGEEVTEELEFVPASMFVTEHVRVKYACRPCEEGVVIGDLPPRPIEKGRPGPGLLAQLVTSKYGDHLPLHRQEEIFARHGVSISRSTMCDWIRDTASLLSPIVRTMRSEVLSTGLVLTDDTPIRVQTGSKKTKKAAIWAYLSPAQKEVVFDFTMSRARDGPERFLGDYRGYLQADAYSGYDRIFDRSEVTEVGCWAHARRKFYESMDTSPEEASAVMAGIRRLYRIEAKAKEEHLAPAAVRDLRCRESLPILQAIREYLLIQKITALPQSPFGKAITYALNQWEALVRYVGDGRLPIDNNAAERALRTVAIGRKNWLFAGSPAGGTRAATLYSLVSSCRLQGIDPFVYLRDVIERISTHPMSRIAEFTPRGWAEEVREHLAD